MVRFNKDGAVIDCPGMDAETWSDAYTGILDLMSHLSDDSFNKHTFWAVIRLQQDMLPDEREL